MRAGSRARTMTGRERTGERKGARERRREALMFGRYERAL